MEEKNNEKIIHLFFDHAFGSFYSGYGFYDR